MNTKTLSKHYHALTAAERLPLIAAAAVRGDDLERKRLIETTPSVGLRVPDTYLRVQALGNIAVSCYLELLSLAAEYLENLALAASFFRDENEEHLALAFLRGFMFKLKLAGWRQFATEQGLEPNSLWESWPGFAILQRAEERAEQVAFGPQVMRDWLRGQTAVDLSIITPESVAADWRAAFEAQASR